MEASPSEKQGQLDKLNPLRHHTHRKAGDQNVFGESFAERMAEKVATGMGTVQFVIIGSLIILGWVFTNGAVHYINSTVKALQHGGQFDPEPWILLNLIFSGVAFYTGSLVIIASKAQAKKQNADELAAAEHREELAKDQINLLTKNTDLTEQVHKLAEKLSALTEEVHQSVCKGQASA